MTEYSKEINLPDKKVVSNKKESVDDTSSNKKDVKADFDNQNDKKSIEGENAKKSEKFKNIFTQSTSSIFDRPVTEKAVKQSEFLFLNKEEKNENLKEKEIIKDDPSVHFNEYCNLYILADKTIEQRGTGNIYIKEVDYKENTSLYKITMVREKIGLLGCNHFILGSIYKHSSPRTFIFSSNNDNTLTSGKKMATFLVKFDKQEIADKFENCYKDKREINLRLLKTK